MLYLVDGHNLIPKLPGLNLRQIDDEERLIELLQTFSRVRRHTVEVYFDGAPPGQAGTRSYGSIKAHFVPAGQTADEALHRRLKRMQRGARQVTLVSSDRRVLAEARRRQAALLTSEQFAALVMDAKHTADAQPGAPPAVSAGDLDEWLRLFGETPQKR